MNHVQLFLMVNESKVVGYLDESGILPLVDIWSGSHGHTYSHADT